MPGPPLPPLAEWETFYVITGSSAAALTGLMFVVVALRSDTKAEGEDEGVETGVRAFGSPTVVHFCAVLLIASLHAIPQQTRTTLALCMGAIGIAGVALAAWVVVQARRQHAYDPVPSDWVWHVILPLVAYAALVAGAVALRRQPEPALDVVAVVSLLILFIGIHNAWDAAVWIASRRA